jgi:hypothetical protein
MLQQLPLVQLVVEQGVMNDLVVISLLLSRVYFFPLRFCLILCPLVLLRKVRIEAFLAV